MTFNVEFPEEAIRNFHRAERELRELAPEIAKAESCGIECDGHRAIVEELQRRIDQMKAAYPQLTRVY